MREILFAVALACVACDTDTRDDDESDDDAECGQDIYLDICSASDCVAACEPSDTHDGWACECLCHLARRECIIEMGCPTFGCGECWEDPQTDFCPCDEQDCSDHNPY